MTAPPDETQLRRHLPNRLGYGNYRDCLRWDFGFTCAFCLLHETDLDPRGSIGTALITIEHFEPRARRADLEDDYRNCILACRMCNTQGGEHENEEGGARLLDPTATAWSKHFMARGDELVPQDGDRDAAYTARVYGINRRLQKVRRRSRREAITEAMYVVERLPSLIRDLDAQAQLHLQRHQPMEAMLLLRSIAEHERTLAAAREQLRRHAPIPTDRPERCRCAVPDVRSLPRWLNRQLVPIG